MIHRDDSQEIRRYQIINSNILRKIENVPYSFKAIQFLEVGIIGGPERALRD